MNLPRPVRRAVLLTLLLLQLGVCAGAEPAGRVNENTPWETPYYVNDSGQAGPTVMIVGGIHGDEPAGAAAAEQIRHWPLAAGRLVIVPRANPPALCAKTRTMPDHEPALANLNRNFPRSGPSAAPRGDVADGLWQLVRQQHPDWLLDLHEGYGVRAAGSASVGSSVIYKSTETTQAAAQGMLAAVNASIDDAKRQFVPLASGPVSGSLARAAAEQLGIPALILETTHRNQPLSGRVRQHRVMVHALLSRLAMAAGDVHIMTPGVQNSRTHPGEVRERVCVGVYDGGGVGKPAPPAMDRVLNDCSDVVSCRFGEVEVRAGAITQFDAIIFPGGSGSKQAAAIGPEGREAVRRFVERGGGYVGICAGAYLATHGYTWGLKIIDARTVDSQHWKRGSGTVTIDITERGAELLRTSPGEVEIRYANGPLLAPAEVADLPDYDVLAYFRSELAENGAPSGVMVNTPAIIAAPFGAGRVMLLSPHAESVRGLEAMVEQAVTWSAQSEATAALSP